MPSPQQMMVALGDPTRQAIFDELADGPLPVGQIAAALPVTRSAISQHLKVLKAAGLVSDRPQGTRRLYQIDQRGLAILRTHLDQFWQRSLTGFAEAITDQTKESR